MEDVRLEQFMTSGGNDDRLQPRLCRNDCMAIVPFPLPPGAEARLLLHHLLEHGDVVGKDDAGRTMILLAVDERVLEKLMTFDAEAADLEDGGDAEPEPDDEEDGPPVRPDLVRPIVERRRVIPFGKVD